MLNSITSPLDGIRSPFGAIRNPFAAYNIGGQTPQTIADFEADKYRADGATSTAASLLTHTRTGNATQVADDGTLQWAGHNLLKYSEQFDNVNWVKSNAAITADISTAPDGTVTAERITATAGTSSHAIYQNLTSVSTPTGSTFSVYAKADTVNILGLGNDGNGRAMGFFDLTSGTVLSTAKAIATITPVGDSWYRCSITNTGGETFSYPVIAPHQTVVDQPFSSWTAAGTESIFIWGAHVYRSDLGGMADIPTSYRGLSSSSTYLPTTSSARYLPRVDNHIWDGSSWVKRCLVEPQSTNLITYSQDFTDASWLAAGFLNTPSSPSETGPDGQTSATQIIDDNSTGTGVCYLRQDVTVSTSTTYTFSAFLKADQLAHALIYLSGFTTPAADGYFIDLSDGTTSAYSAGTGITPNVESVGNGWYRFAITFTTDAADTAGQIRIYVSSGDTVGDEVVDLDGTSSILIYGAQLEESSIPTSYIPTAGSQVTRPADALSIDSTLLPYDSTAMTIAMDGEMTYADEDKAPEVKFTQWADGESANSIRQELNTNGPNVGRMVFRTYQSSTASIVIGASDDYSSGVNVPFNIASRHTSSDLNGAVDGTALTADTTPTALPDLSATDFEIAPTGVINIKSLRILGGYGATDVELEAATS